MARSPRPSRPQSEATPNLSRSITNAPAISPRLAIITKSPAIVPPLRSLLIAPSSHYRACLELLDPIPERESSLRAKLAEALVNSGRGVDAAREFEAAAHHSPAKAKIELERNAAFHYAASGYILEGNAIFERVLQRVGLSFPTSKRAVLFSILSSSFRLRLMGSRFRERDLSRVSPATLARFDAASAVAKPMSLTNTALGMNFGLLALLIAMRSGDPVRFVYGLECAYVLALQGREPRRRAEALIEIAREIVARHDDANLKGAFLLTEAGVAYVQAKWKECIRLLDEAEDTYVNHTRGTYFHVAQVRSLQLYTLWSMGEFLDLSNRSAPFLEEAEQVGDLFFSANIRTFSRPLAYLAADRPGTASESVLSGLARGRRRAISCKMPWPRSFSPGSPSTKARPDATSTSSKSSGG